MYQIIKLIFKIPPEYFSFLKLIVGFPLKTLLLEKLITNLDSINLLKMFK